MDFTGERYVSSLSGPIQHEHYHRYLLAAQFCAGRDVLDIACGEGYGSAMLGSVAASVTGVDIDPAAVAYALTTYVAEHVTFAQGSATRIPLANASVDVVVSFETLEHFAEHDDFMKEVQRVLRPGGLLIISSPNAPVYTGIDGHVNVRELDETEFRDLLGRYFAHTQLLSQRAVCGSLLLSESAAEGMVGFETADGHTFQVSSGLPSTHYFLALASDATLPQPSHSVLLDPSYLPTLSDRHSASEIHAVALAREIGIRDTEIARLNVELTRSVESYQNLAALPQQLAEQTNRNHALATEADRLSEAFSVHRSQIARLGGETRQLNGELTRFAESYQHLAALPQQLTEQTDRNHALATEAARLREAFSAHRRQIARLGGETRQQALELDQRARQIAVLEQRAAELNHETNRLAWELSSRDRRVVELEGETMRLHAHPAIRLAGLLRRAGLTRRRAQMAIKLVRWTLSGELPTRLIERRAVHQVYASRSFDVGWYLSCYPDVAASGTDPVLHYLRHGASENRDPSPQFSTAFYRERHKELPPRANPLVDALRHNRLADGVRPALPQPTHVATASHPGRESVELVFTTRAPAEIAVILDARQGLSPLLPALSVLVADQEQVALELVLLVSPGSEIQLTGARRLLCAPAEGTAAWRAVGLCEAPLAVVLAPGVSPGGGAMAAFVRTFQQHPGAGLIGGKILDGGSGSIIHAGGTVGPDGRVTPRGAGLPRAHYAAASVCPIHVVLPGMVAVSRSALGGGLRPMSRLEQEPRQMVDLSLQLDLAGHPTIYQPFAEATASHGLSTDAGPGGADILARFRAIGRGPARPRALFVDYQTPTPDRDSGSGDLWWLMRIAQNLGYEVTFLPTFSTGYAGTYTDTLRSIGVICVASPESPSVDDFIRQHAASFDIAIVHRVSVARGCLAQLRAAAPLLRIVFNTVDLHHLREMREAQMLGSPAKEAAARATRDVEFAMMRAADLTILLSRAEQSIVHAALPEVDTRIIPIVRDIPVRTASPLGRADVVFVGGYQHLPNIDAITRFAAVEWKQIRARLPSLRLLVVGSHPTPEVLALADPSSGIEVLGHVPDLTSLLARCRLMVAPLRYGAGIKGKVVTSLTHGVPCVASTIAVEGMGLTAERDVLIADTQADWADAVARLVEDDGLWQDVSDAGLTFAREHFSVEHVTDLMRELLTTLGLPSAPVSDEAAEQIA